MNKPAKLTTTELFDLGVAYGSFSVGDIDQGIHMVLPMCEVGGTEVVKNAIFGCLVDHHFYNIDYPSGWESDKPYPHDSSELGELYCNAIIAWAKSVELDIGREAL